MSDTPPNTFAPGSAVVPYAQAEARRRPGPFAVAGLTCGVSGAILFATVGVQFSPYLLSLFAILSVAAIGLGERARRDTNAPFVHRSIAVAAVWLGGIELAVAFLMLLMFPNYTPRIEHANRIKCRSNLRQIGQAIESYTAANQNRLPVGLDILVLHTQLDIHALQCPSSNHERPPGNTLEERVQSFRSSPNHCSVVYLGAGLTRDSIAPRQILVYEFLENHEKEGMNVLYEDGTVKWLAKEEAAHVVSELTFGFNPPRRPSSQR